MTINDKLELLESLNHEVSYIKENFGEIDSCMNQSLISYEEFNKKFKFLYEECDSSLGFSEIISETISLLKKQKTEISILDEQIKNVYSRFRNLNINLLEIRDQINQNPQYSPDQEIIDSLYIEADSIKKKIIDLKSLSDQIYSKDVMLSEYFANFKQNLKRKEIEITKGKESKENRNQEPSYSENEYLEKIELLEESLKKLSKELNEKDLIIEEMNKDILKLNQEIYNFKNKEEVNLIDLSFHELLSELLKTIKILFTVIYKLIINIILIFVFPIIFLYRKMY